jgi:hypothetical protein
MAPKTKKQRREDNLETNVADAPDALRREDLPETTPDSMPPRQTGKDGDKPAGGGFTPATDGGNPQHPVHDEDQEDAEPSDYERELDRLAAAATKP